MIKKAQQIAREAHAGQKYGDNPYFDYHIEGVVANLKKNSREYLGKHYQHYWLSSEITKDSIIAAAYLHDAIEDGKTTESTTELIRGNFGELTVKVVFGMTKMPNDEYADYIIGMNHPALIAVKLADLDFNIAESEGCKINSYQKQRLQKYKLARHILMPRA